MNKNIAIVITAVILLGMALITYNEYATPVAPPFSAQGTDTEKQEQIRESDAASQANVTPQSAPEKPAPIAPVAVAPAPAAPALTAPTAPAKAPLAPSTAPAPKVAEETKTVPALTPAQAPKETPVEQKSSPAPVKPVAESKVEEDPVQKALEASKKESTLPILAQEPVKKAPVAKVIKRITVSKVGDGTTVRLDSTVTPEYTTMRLSSPERLVIDLDGVWKLRAPGVPSNAFVSNVRIGDHKSGSRIVIDLKKAPADIRYLKYGETGLDIRIR